MSSSPGLALVASPPPSGMLRPPSRRPSPAPSESTYRYQPFASDQSIRVLTLLPGEGADPLRGFLSVASVREPPAYEAISYCWGDPTRCASIELLDERGPGRGSPTGDVAGMARKTLGLTRSLYDALVRIRLPDRSRAVWADQVCINQDDVAERGRQVRFMNQIYHDAQHVLVWLGPDEGGHAARAVEFVEELSEVLADPERAERFRKEHEEGLSDRKEEPWVPLKKLTQLPWFNRMWIVQEIGTSAPATLFWGDASIDWRLLARVADLLSRFYHLRRRFAIWTPHVRYLYRRFVDPHDGHAEDSHRNRRDFVYELHRARHLLAKDPRDHVYGMLGHYSFRDGRNRSLLALDADYGRSVEETFVKLAVLELRGAESLILLAAVQHASLAGHPGAVPSTGTTATSDPELGDGPVPTEAEDETHLPPSKPRKRPPPDPALRLRNRLPTWVPNWLSPPVHLLHEPETPHRAAGNSRPRLEVDESSRTLFAQGMRIDAVAACSPVLYARDFNFNAGARPRTVVVDLWRGVCGHGGEVDLATPYVTGGESAFLAMALALTNGGALAAAQSGRRHWDVPRAEWLPHGAAYVAKALERLERGGGATASAGLLEAAARGDPYKWSHEATLVSRGRRFARTEKGYFVSAAAAMEPGDVVCVLFGGRTPFVLRPVGGEEGPGDETELEAGGGERFLLVGECYAHGLMEGEAMEMLRRGEVREECFKIV